MQTIIKITQGTPRKEEWRMAAPVDFETSDGQHIAIIGANGSGKSMFVDMITGRHPLLHNQAVYDFRPSDKTFVSDNIRLVSFKDSYGEGDSTYFLQQRWNLQEMDDDLPTVEEMLKKYRDPSGLSFFPSSILHSPMVLLSSGELRKFELAKALLANPRVLIIDNPYIGLDVEARKQLTEALEDIIRNRPLQIILELSRKDDIPAFITHVVEVKDRVVGPLIPVADYLNPTAGEPVISFQDVSIVYGERTILKNLNWTVNRGEHWAVKGPNGSGKSTLLSLVCADNPQGYAANISLFGHQRGSGESIWQIKHHIGYVSPEMHRAYRHNLPTIDIVASGLKDTMGLYVRPTAIEKEVCLKWMGIFGIETLAERPFLQLSSGEQRLALLARAFVKEPDLLILDEPLHGLDDGRCIQVKRIINDYCQNPSRTLIMVTHYDQELPSCIDHTLHLKKHS